nr:MAG TPA: hypothetical protein [Caudoviricetes sp.]
MYNFLYFFKKTVDFFKLMLYNKVNKTDLTIFFYLKCRKKSTEGADKNEF